MQEFIRVTLFSKKERFLIRKSDIESICGIPMQGAYIRLKRRRKIFALGRTDFIPVNENVEEIFAMLNESTYKGEFQNGSDRA